jgi:hypothetical protein
MDLSPGCPSALIQDVHDLALSPAEIAMSVFSHIANAAKRA